ncbi:IQ motif EF-hand binding site [Lasiodiplodia theobromae]|uniref:IQ motif EF-hand binding site n=1 Tax=Lasiodiplodia theobromae TaxID=45133 RepID=UPI0015C2F793|nr:IQ motif EF-hand binding site [Lasiodiplodia theobromae]KAF4542079.1 IQ motif EF-hand binding site [Lasiodiplodia theobromae]
MSYSPTRPRSTLTHQASSPSPLRQASTASNGSSGYSSNDAPSRTSTVSSSSNGVTDFRSVLKSHRRGLSENTTLVTNQDSLGQNAAGTYLSMRSKLRPLPHAPASPPSSPEKAHTPTHSRSKSYAPTSSSPPITDTAPPRMHTRSPNPPMTPHSPPAQDTTPPRLHNRSQSLDPFSTPQLHSSASPTSAMDGSTSPTKQYSMALSRSDTVRAPARERPKSVHFAPQLEHPDLKGLERSTTAQLRTLSKFGASGDEEFSIKSPDEEVVGMHGRRKLQRGMSTRGKKVQSGWATRTWMDQQRQFLQAYEYLCHIGEAKEWIEDIIDKPIPPIVQLEEALRDGVTLAEIVQALNPEKPIRIFRHPKLQFRHSDNIALFFRFLHDQELPELFRFELVDLYEKKNIPKVIYCIHALSWLLFRKGVVDFRIGNLVGQLQFEDHELEEMQKGLDKSGVSMPNFSGMSANFGEPEPEPEPVETEEERIERELAEHESIIVDLQAQIRGAMERMRLGGIMQGLWDSEDWLVDLQSRIRGDFSRQIAEYKMDMRRFAVNLQSASRGFIVRSKHRSKEEYWRNNEKEVVTIQSLVRARKARAEVQHTKTRVQHHEPGIRLFQAAIRGALKRRDVGDQYEATQEAAAGVTELQAAIRGALLRKNIEDQLADLQDAELGIQALQSAIRGALLRKKVEDQLAAAQDAEIGIQALQSAIRGALLRKQVDDQWAATQEAGNQIELLQALTRGMLIRKAQRAEQNHLRQQEAVFTMLQGAIRGAAARAQTSQLVDDLSSNEVHWAELQAAARGNALRSSINQLRERLASCTDGIVELQSAARGAQTRAEVAETLSALAEQEETVIDLQSAIRGQLLRQKYQADLKALEAATPNIIEFQSAIRGFAMRGETYDILCALAENEDQVVELQALARAMLARAKIGNLLMNLEPEEEAICELQSLARGKMIRTRFVEKQKFYRENMEKVIKIQSFVRGRQQGEAYKSLTAGKNPPVSTVKNFVHLLNDSDIDFDEEIEFERLRKTVVQHIRQNEMAEQYIDQLDIKIALLVRNKITLDEVVKHQRHFGGHVGNLLTNKELASKDPFDLRALNKNSRKKLEHYQEFFFILQTQPQYLARLFKKLRDQGMAEKESKRVELLIMGLFGFAQKRREEYYLLKLISRSIREEVDMCGSIQDYLRGNFFWTKVLGNYVRTPRDRKYLRELLQPLIKENIMENEALDLESDPLQIYRSAINNEELRTGRRSRRMPDVPREEAIRDPETRETFIRHLQDLRDIADQFFSCMEELLHKMPYGMRFVAQQQYEALCGKFPHEEPQHVLQIIGHWLWKTYLQPALVQPETWGVIDRGLSPLQKRNLGEVAKPLNSYITEAIGRLEEIWTTLITIRPAETQFDIDEFNDLYSTQKPTLYIKLSDIFAIHQLVASDLPSVCIAQEDIPLRELLRELGSAKGNEHELSGVNATEISLTLNPKFHEVEDAEAPIKALFMETKRCVLYIIRIQTGPDLLSIMVKPVTDDDEDRWAALIQEEILPDNDRQRSAYTDTASPLIDIASLSYTELKRTALENVLTLEQTGRITRDNKYQDLLNDIAIDIRTKHRRRIQRSREMENIRATLTALDSKSEWLDSQLKSYNNYIEQAMITLQSKKGKKRFLLPFTKQYNHERELQRRGQVPKFGSFKYSARALGEKGVLVEWRGYTDRDRGWEKTNVTISSDQVGIFLVEGSVGSMMIPGASAVIPLDDLLQAQFENKQFIHLFGGEDGAAQGSLKLNVNLLLHLVFKKFYRDGGS